MRNSRFVVDPFGRILYPNALASYVGFIDNAGNEIVRFGSYGNRDSMGGLKGDLVPIKGVPLAFPKSVGVTDGYLYVGDLVNARLLRLKRTFKTVTSLSLK